MPGSERSAHFVSGDFEPPPMPKRMAKAIKLASDSDRRWFAANPDRSHRLRPSVRGEFPADIFPPRPGQIWTVVRQQSPGVRFRLGLHAPDPLPDVEALAHAVFDLLAEAAAAAPKGSNCTTISRDAIFLRAMAMAHAGQA